MHRALTALLPSKGSVCCCFVWRIKLQKDLWERQIVRPFLQWSIIHQIPVYLLEHLKYWVAFV